MIEHKHLIVRAEINLPPKWTELGSVGLWFRTLIAALGMKVLKGPYADYVHTPGNRGATAVAIIETSHIAMHVWDEQSPALMQLDVYSCSHLDPAVVFNALKQFEPVSVKFKFLDRENELKEIACGQSSS